MSAIDELHDTVSRAKVCAARCDADGLMSAMKDIESWMWQHGKKLEKDVKAKARVTRDLSRLRDVASVMSGALSEALTAATGTGEERGYGRKTREETSSILARGYG